MFVLHLRYGRIPYDLELFSVLHFESIEDVSEHSVQHTQGLVVMLCRQEGREVDGWT